MTVTGDRDVASPGGLPHPGGHDASPDPSNDGASLVTNPWLPPIDRYGFALADNQATCTHCDVGGHIRDWPKHKRVAHFEREHKRQVVATKAAVTRAARREWSEQPTPTAAEMLDLWREQHGGEDPTPGELIAFVEKWTLQAQTRTRGAVQRQDQRHRSRRWVAAREPRPCRECGDVFEPADPRQVFCTPACRKRYAYLDANRVANRELDRGTGGRQVTSRTPNDGGASLVTNEGVRPPRCAYCGGPFDPKRTDQRFCQNKCRQAAYRERKGQEVAEA